MFFHDAPRTCPVWTPGAWLAGFIKWTTIHCYRQNMKALGLVVSEKIFLCFSHCKSMGPNDPRGRAIFAPPGAWLAGFIKRTTIHCYKQNMKAPRTCPVWTPGAWLAGFIKWTTIHCYRQNMKALGLVVSEKIFLCFSHCKSMGSNDPRDGAIFDPMGIVTGQSNWVFYHIWVWWPSWSRDLETLLTSAE